MPKSTGRRRRPLRVLAIIAIIIVGLAVAADRVGVAVAERAAADTLQNSQHFPDRPSVSIAGFPFLTQVVAGKLDDVTVRAKYVVVGNNSKTLRLEDVVTTLRGLSRTSTTVHADSGEASGVVPYSELSRNLGADVSYAGAGRVKASRVVMVAGQSVTGSVSARVTVVNGTLRFDSPAASADGVQVPPSVTGELESLFNLEIPLSNLPFRLQVRSLAAQPDGVAITLTGQDLTFQR